MSSAACATENSSAVPVCPAIVPYTRDFQARAAEELHALPEGSSIGVLIEDYGRLRAQIRAACKEE